MSKLKRAVFLQLASWVLAVGVVLWLSRHYPVMDYLVRLQSSIGALGWKGGALYPLLYACCNLLLLPGGILAIGSGLFFGLWWGFALNLAANVLASAGAFFISRTFGRKWIASRFLRSPKWTALDEAIERDGWKIILLSQLPPLSPVSLLNYLYGITRIPFRTCILWVAIGQTPSMFLYAYLGTMGQRGLLLWQGRINPQTHEYCIWIGGLVLTLVATIALGRIAIRALANAEKVAHRAAAPARSRSATPEPVTIEAEAP